MEESEQEDRKMTRRCSKTEKTFSIQNFQGKTAFPEPAAVPEIIAADVQRSH